MKSHVELSVQLVASADNMWSLPIFNSFRPKWIATILQRWVIPALTLTLNVRGPSYLGLIRSISWLLMPWLLTSPGHQQPWYWPCRICRSCLRKDFKYLCHINLENKQSKLRDKSLIFIKASPIFTLLAKATANWHQLTHNTPKHFQTC